MHRSYILAFISAVFPAGLATFILLTGGSGVLRDGQYVSGPGVGALGTLYAATVMQVGLLTKRDGVLAAGLFVFIASIAIYAMGWASSMPIFDSGF